MENQEHDRHKFRIVFTLERGREAGKGKKQHRRGYNFIGNILFFKLDRGYTDVYHFLNISSNSAYILLKL